MTLIKRSIKGGRGIKRKTVSVVKENIYKVSQKEEEARKAKEEDVIRVSDKTGMRD